MKPSDKVLMHEASQATKATAASINHEISMGQMKLDGKSPSNRTFRGALESIADFESKKRFSRINLQQRHKSTITTRF